MQTQKIEYQDGEQILEVYVAHRAKSGEKKPTVIVFPTWTGRDEFACKKADLLAELGYVGIAFDLYGKGVVGSSQEENQRLMGPLVQDRKMLRRRMLSGLNTILTLPFVNRERMAAIGFCFGGLCALDLARSGADMKGIVSFHGFLNAPADLERKPIHAKILVLHGHDDPMVPPGQVLAFEQEMTAEKVDWQVHTYGNTQHAFTNPKATDPSSGMVYQEAANRRSWQSMKQFLDEVFV